MTPCCPASHIIDSRFFADAYGTLEARQVFCDYRRMQRWLDVEVALAQCQAELGIIPAPAAQALRQTARLEGLNLAAIKADITTTGHSLIPLLKEWQRVTEKSAGQFIHYGATTQDIQDTAQSLELQEIVAILQRDLASVIALLSTLADKNRDLVTIGRSHGQHALPTTMGLKIAGWLDETLRNSARLESCRGRLLVAQLFGGVGTMAALSEKALPLLDKFAQKLGLAAPSSCWHSSRDRMAEFTSVLALITGGLARIANEVCQLARNEIGEMTEPFVHGQIGSTTMPHKKNPELCEQVVVLSRLVKANATTSLDTLCNEHERDYRAVRLEWVALTEASIFSCASLRLMKSILGGLSINRKRIQENLERFAILISTEALMFLLGEKIGKQSAHALIYEASMGSSLENQAELLDRLMACPEVNAAFCRTELEQAIDPSRHTGLAGAIIDLVLTEAKKSPPTNPFHPTACTLRLSGICACP
ncbi:MAG: adenylosuccinate lyase family protein [Desulfobulbaceae bacterium]|nr:adenylosuccinate lyase family protein [Desulfobulbaceae bacterium]